MQCYTCEQELSEGAVNVLLNKYEALFEKYKREMAFERGMSSSSFPNLNTKSVELQREMTKIFNLLHKEMPEVKKRLKK